MKTITESLIKEKKNMSGWSKKKVWVPELHESGSHFLSKNITLHSWVFIKAASKHHPLPPKQNLHIK